MGSSHLFRRRLAVTTILTVVPFLGYGRPAHAACDPLTLICSGENAVTQVIVEDNADVSTLPGFNVDAAAGNGMTITGNGHVRFTDENAATIEGTGMGLAVTSTGDAGTTPGAVTITANSSIRGGFDGINGRNYGSGDLAITANGDVRGTIGTGIFAENFSTGASLTITTGAGSAITGMNGIFGENRGGGDLTIIANGAVTGEDVDGIYGRNSSNGGSLIITTGAESAITGDQYGIRGNNFGTGNIEITANGEVTGTRHSGILAANSSAGADLTVTTGAGSTITGYYMGIHARNYGSGDLTITADGDVTGTLNAGIFADNSPNGAKLTITTGAGSRITGVNGIFGENRGGGDLSIIANGAVTGEDSDGIYGRNSSNGDSLIITTGAESAITGNQFGIRGNNVGSGNLEITVDGEVSGTGHHGIHATNASAGADLTVTTGAGSTIAGHYMGIFAYNSGRGDLTVTVDGAVTAGDSGGGIFAENRNGGGLAISTGTGSVITSGAGGILGRNYGRGNIEITVNGAIAARGSTGIYSLKDGLGDNIIKVGASGLVQGLSEGIVALSTDGQVIAITNDGEVRNISGASDKAVIWTEGGATTIDNNGRLTGAVELDTYDDTLSNAGTWNMANGVSKFGAGYDTLNNSGTLIAAHDATKDEVTLITGLERFANSGVIALTDGQAKDLFILAEGVEFAGQGGRLAVDAVLAEDGISDRLIIDGDVSGVTRVSVNVLGMTGVNRDGIAVIEVSGDTAAGDFQLTGGVLNTGFFAWDLRLDDTDGNIFELYTKGLGAGAYEFAAGITGAQDIWQQTTGTLLQRQADLRATIQSTQVTPVADFSEPVSPTAAGQVGPGFWFKALGGYLERDGGADDIILDRKQTVFGGLAGFDVVLDDTILLGLFGGYLTSDLKFKSTGTKWDFEGPSLGAYATWLNEAFYADLTVKADFLSIDIDADDLGPGQGKADTDAINLGGQLDLGYKIGLAHGLFVEPQASLSVLHTEIDDIDDIFGGQVAFDDATSVKGRLGLRLGHDFTAGNAVVYSSDMTASVWQDFSGDNNAIITAFDLPATEVADDPGRTIGDLSLGFSMTAPEGWSGFLRGHYQFTQDLDAVTGTAGLRYAW
jgi:autotransporter family porin